MIDPMNLHLKICYVERVGVRRHVFWVSKGKHSLRRKIIIAFAAFSVFTIGIKKNSARSNFAMYSSTEL